MLVVCSNRTPENTPACPSIATGRAQVRMTTPFVCASSRSNRLAFMCSDAAPVDHGDALGAEQLRLHGDVDRRHAAADDDDPAADRQRRQVLGLAEEGDVVDRVGDVLEIALALEAELVGRRQAEAEKDRVVIAPERFDRDRAPSRAP